MLLKKRRKQKSKCQKERDRHRAQAFQAKSIAEKHDLIFPFSGKLLTVKKSNIFPVEEQNDVDEVISDSDQIAAPAVSSIAATVSSASLTAVTPPTLPVPAVLPTRKSSKNQDYIDVDVAKKHLFPTTNNPTQPSTPSGRPPDRSYKKKEEDLWSKLFQ